MKNSLFLLLFFLVTSLSANDLNSKIKEIIRDSQVPSLAAAVIVDGKLIDSAAYGIRKQGSSETVTINDKYHIGFCTKSMTSVLAAILVQKKKITRYFHQPFNFPLRT